MRDLFVVGVTATFERAESLKRMLRSLSEAGPELRAFVVVDNSPSATAREVANSAQFEVIHCHPGQNLGCGAGLHLGMETAFDKFGDRITHFLLLDDDVEFPANAVSSLLDLGCRANAEVICPMIVDKSGVIGWFPGLSSPVPWKVIRRVKTPKEYWRECGLGPVRFSWSTGVCLLISQRAVRVAGLPAKNFWVRGEDLEYSLRLTSRCESAFVPGLVVRHLVADSVQNGPVGSGEVLKHLAMMQNLAYMITRLPHGRRVLRHFPGNVYRFIRAHGLTWSSIRSLIVALWLGFMSGRPAGAAGYNTFQRQFAQLYST
jgi:GT2 family glycosyltransferase